MKKYILAWGMMTIFLLSACYYYESKEDIYIIKYYTNNEIQQWITKDIRHIGKYCEFINSETNSKIIISGSYVVTEQRINK